MVEKKTTKKVSKTPSRAKKTSSRPQKKVVKKSTVTPSSPKTVVQTVPVKVKKDVCVWRDCCTLTEKILSLLILLLVLVNLALAGLLAFQRCTDNQEKILQLGGEENYVKTKELIQMQNELQKDKQRESIDAFVDQMLESSKEAAKS